MDMGVPKHHQLQIEKTRETDRPSVGTGVADALVFAPVSFAGSAIGSTGSSVMMRRSGGVARVGGASRRWQRPSLDRIRVTCRRGEWLLGEPRTTSLGPYFSYIALCDGAHQPCRVGRP